MASKINEAGAEPAGGIMYFKGKEEFIKKYVAHNRGYEDGPDFNIGDRVIGCQIGHPSYKQLGTVLTYIPVGDHYLVEMDYGDKVYGNEWELDY